MGVLIYSGHDTYLFFGTRMVVSVYKAKWLLLHLLKIILSSNGKKSFVKRGIAKGTRKTIYKTGLE